MEVEGRSKPLSQEQCVEAQSLRRARATSARPPVQQGRGRSLRAVCPAARPMAPLAIGHHRRGGGAQWTLSFPGGVCSSASVVHPDGAPVLVLEASFPAPPCRTPPVSVSEPLGRVRSLAVALSCRPHGELLGNPGRLLVTARGSSWRTQTPKVRSSCLLDPLQLELPATRPTAAEKENGASSSLPWFRGEPGGIRGGRRRAPG